MTFSTLIEKLVEICTPEVKELTFVNKIRFPLPLADASKFFIACFSLLKKDYAYICLKYHLQNRLENAYVAAEGGKQVLWFRPAIPEASRAGFCLTQQALSACFFVH